MNQFQTFIHIFAYLLVKIVIRVVVLHIKMHIDLIYNLDYLATVVLNPFRIVESSLISDSFFLLYTQCLTFDYDVSNNDSFVV